MSYCENVHCSSDPCTVHDPKSPSSSPSKPVLLAVDGSPFSIYAVRWAMHMYDADFIILHAYDFVATALNAGTMPLAAGGDNTGEYLESLRTQAELTAYRVLQNAEKLFEESGRSARLLKALIIRGDARSVITNCIKEFGIEVLVIGSRGTTGIARVLGSVSDHLLHHSSCHVCIVHPPPEIPRPSNEQSLLEMVVELPSDDASEAKMEQAATKAALSAARTIFLALDGSEQGQKGFEWARDHFLKKGDQVVLVMAYTPSRERSNSLVGWAKLFGPPTYSFGQEEEKQKKEDTVCGHLKEYAARLGREVKTITGENCRLCLQSGDPRDVICNVTEHAAQVDVLVMGSRGRGLVKRAILGSVVDYVATHANCSLMVVK